MMPSICMHCISNTNGTNIINLILNIIHTPHKTQVGDAFYIGIHSDRWSS